MLKIDSIIYSYKRSQKLFTNLSLELNPGSITCLLGKNGEGKTTLLKLINGELIRKGGHIDVLGYDPSKRDPKALKNIFLLPEEFDLPQLKVREYFSAVTPFYDNYSQEVADELMKEFQIDWGSNLKSLSMGQKKKAMIVLALSLRTPILLMDEPTNGLDIPSKSVFRRMMARYVQEDQLVIISTHQARDLEQIIDRVVVMNNSEIVCNHSINEILSVCSFGEVTPYNKEQAIYTEKSLPRDVGMFRAIPGEQETPFSLELFFNALISNPQLVSQVLSEIDRG